MLPYKKKTIYYFLKHTQILYKCPSIDEKSEEMYFLYIIMLTSQYTNLFVSFVKSIQRNFFNSMQISSGFLLLAILVQLLSGQWFCCKVRKIGKIQTKTKQKKRNVCEKAARAPVASKRRSAKPLKEGNVFRGVQKSTSSFFQSPFQALISTE